MKFTTVIVFLQLFSPLFRLISSFFPASSSCFRPLILKIGFIAGLHLVVTPGVPLEFGILQIILDFMVEIKAFFQKPAPFNLHFFLPLHLKLSYLVPTPRVFLFATAVEYLLSLQN